MTTVKATLARLAERVTPTSRSGTAAFSSEAATAAVLQSGGIRTPERNPHGLAGVVTAAEVDAKLPPGAIVWITFSNHAYLHFAQNWYLSVKAINRHGQVVVAALDPESLAAWVEIAVPTLDFSSFGDASDFRGIGADQARFRRMGAMKVAAFRGFLELNRRVLVSDVDSAWLAGERAAAGRTRAPPTPLAAACR